MACGCCGQKYVRPAASVRVANGVRTAVRVSGRYRIGKRPSTPVPTQQTVVEEKK